MQLNKLYRPTTKENKQKRIVQQTELFIIKQRFKYMYSVRFAHLMGS